MYDVITFLICIFCKLEYLWDEKRYMKIVNNTFLPVRLLIYILKWLGQKRCDFRHSTTLTNKEASTVLCSVVKYAGIGRARKKTRDAVECFLLLECSTASYVLYNKTEHSRGFFIVVCFMITECNNFPYAFAEFSIQTLFFKGVKVASAMQCSLIKHAKISQSQSL